MALADSVNTANAFVGSQGNILAAGSVTVSDTAEENIKSFASGGVSEAEEAAAGGGVDDTETDNQANAYDRASGAIVDAACSLAWSPSRTSPTPSNSLRHPVQSPWADNTGTNNSNGTDRVTSGQVQRRPRGIPDQGPSGSSSSAELYVTTVLTGRLGSIGTTYAQSEGEVGKGGTFGLSGDVNVFTVNNAANAYIAAGASVNQRIHSPAQNVEVESDTNIETINLAGQASLLNAPALFAGAAGAQAGLGGSFEKISYNNASHAYIDSQAKVSSGGDINVNANTFNYILNVAQAGAKSEALGVNGTIIFFNLDNDTEGWIDAGAIINAGHNVLVTAGNTLTDTRRGRRPGHRWGRRRRRSRGSFNNPERHDQGVHRHHDQHQGAASAQWRPASDVNGGERPRARRSSASASRGRSRPASPRRPAPMPTASPTRRPASPFPRRPHNSRPSPARNSASGSLGTSASNFVTETTERLRYRGRHRNDFGRRRAGRRDRGHGYRPVRRGGRRRRLREPRRDRRIGGDR